jgi:hypothetical protein
MLKVSFMRPALKTRWRPVLSLLVAVLTGVFLAIGAQRNPDNERGDWGVSAKGWPDPVVLCQDKSLELSVRREPTDGVKLHSPCEVELANGFTLCPWSRPAALAPVRALFVGSWYARGPPAVVG